MQLRIRCALGVFTRFRVIILLIMDSKQTPCYEFNNQLHLKIIFFCFQPLTCVEFWHMVKQHYGNDLGLSHDDMESTQKSTESNMQTR